MCANSHNQKSFFRIFPLLKLLILIPLSLAFTAQNVSFASAMEGTPLLREEESNYPPLQSVLVINDQGAIRSFHDNNITIPKTIVPLELLKVPTDERSFCTDLESVPEVIVPLKLLQTIDKSIAQEQILFLYRFVKCFANPNLRNKVKVEAKEAAQKAGIDVENDTEFDDFLKKKVLEAINGVKLDKTPSIAQYLKELREYVEEFQKITPSLQNENKLLREQVKGLQEIILSLPDENRLLREHVRGLQEIIPNLQNESKLLREQNALQIEAAISKNKEIKKLQKLNKFLWVILPSIGIVMTITGVFATHYLWRQ